MGPAGLLATPLLVQVNIFVRGVCLQLLKKRHGLANQLRDVDCKLKSAFGIVESDQPEESLTGGKRPSVDTGEHFVQTPKKYRFEHNIQNGVYPLTSSPIAIRRVCAAEFQPIQPPQCPISPVRKTTVTVKVEWPSKNAERRIPTDLEPLGKMLLRGTYKQIANAAWKIPAVKDQLVQLTQKEIEKKVSQLCSKKNPSLLRATDKDSMKTFSMEKLHDEIKERAPFFHSCLSTASINRRSKATSTININFASVAMVASVCLKNRSRYMTAVQLLITIFLYHSSWMVSKNLSLLINVEFMFMHQSGRGYWANPQDL